MSDSSDTVGGGESAGIGRCRYLSGDGVCCDFRWDHEGLHSFEIDEMSGIDRVADYRCVGIWRKNEQRTEIRDCLGTMAV